MKPLFPTHIIKQHAKQGMNTNFFKALAITMLPALIISAIATVIMLAIPAARSNIELLMSSDPAKVEGATYSLTLVISPLMVLFSFLEVGAAGAALDMIRGKEVKVKNIFRYFDKWYITAVFPLFTFLTSYGTGELATWAEKAGADKTMVMILLGLCDIISLIISMKLIFLNYTLADSDCKSLKEAIKTAWKMTGITTIVNNYILVLSFFLWYILIAFTCGMAMFYVYPYVMFSLAALYDLNHRFAKGGMAAFGRGATATSEQPAGEQTEDECEYVDANDIDENDDEYEYVDIDSAEDDENSEE